MPTVSVLMPVRNAQRFVGEAVKSILRQTFHDFELIVVDDGSDDETAPIVETYARIDSRVCLLRQSSSGLIPALITAQTAAKGQYIARMDGDDIAHPNRFEEQLNFLSRNSNVVAVGGQVHIIDQDNNIVRTGRYPLTPLECRSYLDFGSPFCHPATMIRKASFDEVNGYRSWFQRAEDYVLWLRLAKIGDLANLDRVVLKLRVHGTNTSTLNAAANAGAVAMALTESRFGSESIANAVRLPNDSPWPQREARIHSRHREFARTTYLRALILNSGITAEPDGHQLLLDSIPAILRGSPPQNRKPMLAFMLLRAALQYYRKGKFLSCFRVMTAALVHAPIETITEIIASLKRRARTLSH